MSEKFSKLPLGLKVFPVHHKKTTPTPLVPLEVPPEVSLESLPPFPLSPGPSPLDTFYTRSTHYVPAAFPRTTPDVPPTPPPNWSENKEEYKANVRKTTEEVIAKRMAFLKEKPPGSRKALLSCVSRFVRRGIDSTKPRMGFTLVVSHATGFGKEVGISPILSCNEIDTVVT